MYLGFNSIGVIGPNEKIMTKISSCNGATGFISSGHFNLPVMSRSAAVTVISAHRQKARIKIPHYPLAIKRKASKAGKRALIAQPKFSK